MTSLDLSDTKVHEPSIRASLGTVPLICGGCTTPCSAFLFCAPVFAQAFGSTFVREVVKICVEIVSANAALLYSNVQWFRGGLVFKACSLLFHSTLGLTVI